MCEDVSQKENCTVGADSTCLERDVKTTYSLTCAAIQNCEEFHYFIYAHRLPLKKNKEFQAAISHTE